MTMSAEESARCIQLWWRSVRGTLIAKQMHEHEHRRGAAVWRIVRVFLWHELLRLIELRCMERDSAVAAARECVYDVLEDALVLSQRRQAATAKNSIYVERFAAAAANGNGNSNGNGNGIAVSASQSPAHSVVMGDEEDEEGAACGAACSAGSTADRRSQASDTSPQSSSSFTGRMLTRLMGSGKKSPSPAPAAAAASPS